MYNHVQLSAATLQYTLHPPSSHLHHLQPSHSVHTTTSLVHTIPSSASSAPLDHQRVSHLWPTSRVNSEQLIRCLAQDEEDACSSPLDEEDWLIIITQMLN